MLKIKLVFSVLLVLIISSVAAQAETSPACPGGTCGIGQSLLATQATMTSSSGPGIGVPGWGGFSPYGPWGIFGQYCMFGPYGLFGPSGPGYGSCMGFDGFGMHERPQAPPRNNGK